MKFETVVNGNVNSNSNSNSNSNMHPTQTTEQHIKAESPSSQGPSDDVYEKDIESEEQPNDTDVGGVEGNGAAGCDDDIEKGSSGSNSTGGKKKNARKKRSLNWEEAERGSLLEVIKPKVGFVENRNVDTKSIKAKRMAWLAITKQFNALNFRHRSLEQIQVQWRSMKNSAKREYLQKHPDLKQVNLEGMELIDFIEELQKDTLTTTSSGKRSHNTNTTNKKDILDIDDEDTPLASLPTSTNTSEDTLQTSTIAIPSPPPSAESQNDTQPDPPLRNKKKRGSTANSTTQKEQKDQQQQHEHEQTTPSPTSSGRKRQRRQNSSHSDVDNSIQTTTIQQDSTVIEQTHDNNSPTPAIDSIALENSKYKRQLLDLMKRTRLAEMEYARREHEQRLRYEEMRQDLVLGLYREQEQLKMQQIREEHEMRLRYSQLEHEARMRAFTFNTRNLNAKVKDENSDN